MLAMAAGDPGLLPDQRTLNLARERFGEQAAGRLLAWRKLAEGLADADEATRLERVNRFFNRVPGVDDQTLWGTRDYWATPVEFLARNGGDCEDYALAKYFTLKALGVAPDKLRVTYARAWLARERRMEPHMVLAYYPSPEADPQILDNLRAEILPASQRDDLSPTMGFNAEGLWSARQRGQSGKLAATASIHHWNDLLARMRGELSEP